MISAEQWRAYNDAVEMMQDDARASVESRVAAWLADHPEASVADMREAAKRIVAASVTESDRAAASLAAEWYDATGRANGATLDRAVTAVTYTDADCDKMARYQAEKLEAGNLPAFISACGDFAVDSACRSLNATILRNAVRDKDNGVRFARVTSGRNTCSFCLMLAGRGAVYASRKNAGAFNHWHTHCSCKVVPGYSGNPYEELVEGHNPDDADAAWRHYEELKGRGLPRAQCDALLAAYLDAHGIGGPTTNAEERKLADALDGGVSSALKAFRKDKTIDSYDGTVGRFLSLLGEEYGIDLSGERLVNKKGRVLGADPNGEELWIAVKARASGQFLFATREHKCPDMRTRDGTLVEFKTPKSSRKLNSLLADASAKYDSYPGEKKTAILSLLRLADCEDLAISAAERFERDGSLASVAVLDGLGSWIKE